MNGDRCRHTSCHGTVPVSRALDCTILKSGWYSDSATARSRVVRRLDNHDPFVSEQRGYNYCLYPQDYPSPSPLLRQGRFSSDIRGKVLTLVTGGPKVNLPRRKSSFQVPIDTANIMMMMIPN